MPGIVVWPGITKEGAHSDALVQSEDYYPTLLEGLAIKAAPEQRFDGSSILPALKGGSLPGKAIFQYFPHYGTVPDWLPPAVSVHRDDWKLIRIFYSGENGSHRHLLFNLKDDLSEKTNLAAQQPALVAELDALIETFLKDTHAVVPVPNPAFDPKQYHPELEGKQQPKTKAKAPAKDESDPALQGWKARDCKAAVKNGIVRVTNIGFECFLGFGASKHSGPSTATFRIKAKPGTSHFDWLPKAGKAQNTPFTLQGTDWQEITVQLPATGPLGIVRLYLPMQEQPVEIDWIELRSSDGSQVTRTEF